MAVLDDLKLITLRDGSDALGVTAKQFTQLKQSFNLGGDSEKPVNVVVAGMGGSALAAQLAESWPGMELPYEIVRSYDVPRYVNTQTLFIASSYSGNTEETLSALAQAQKAGASIAIVTSGGKLTEIANQKKYQICELPSGLQPRMAVLYNFKALLSIFAHHQIVKAETLVEIEQLADKHSELTAAWAADIPTNNNLAKQLAERLLGKTPIIYAGPKMYPLAYKWKINFNENAKNTAWCNFYSEYDHNEFIGWTSHPV
jgi:glucose/mannose-6-phosphate isomerase